MGVLTSVEPQLLVAAPLFCAAAAIVTAVMRFKMFNRALEGTKPNERPGIIRELGGLQTGAQSRSGVIGSLENVVGVIEPHYLGIDGDGESKTFPAGLVVPMPALVGTLDMFP